MCHTVTDMRDPKQLAFAIKTVIGSKQYGFEVRRNKEQRAKDEDTVWCVRVWVKGVLVRTTLPA